MEQSVDIHVHQVVKRINHGGGADRATGDS